MGEFEALLGVNPWTALFALANFLFLFFIINNLPFLFWTIRPFLWNYKV